MTPACDLCGTPLATPSPFEPRKPRADGRTLCDVCAAAVDSGRSDHDALRLRHEVDAAEHRRRVATVNGKPWWESEFLDFACEYADANQVNQDAAAAAPFGWRLHALTTIPPDLGRKVAAWAFLGALGLLADSSRLDATIVVAWRREPSIRPATG